jgi:DNA-binding LytR/AlgR family response regulator
MKLRTLIIEDEAPAYRRLHGLLQEHHPQVEVVDVIDTITEAVRWFAHHRAPDLIFSDIQLSDGLSFEIYRQVPPPCPVIFTTAYDTYMLEAFRANGIDYLLKPIEPEDLDRAVRKFMGLTGVRSNGALPDLGKLVEAMQRPKYRDRFLIKLGTKLLPVSITEAAYFLSVDGVTELHTHEGRKHILDPALDNLEQQLDPALFFRLNRQCMASMAAIELVHQHFQGKLKVMLKPSPGIDVLVSREKARGFKEWMDGSREEG